MNALFALLLLVAAPVPHSFTLAALAGALVVNGAMGYAATFGDQIRHTEIRFASAAFGAERGEGPSRIERDD